MATYPPVTLVVGEEEFLVDRAVRQAVAQARAALAAEAGGADGAAGDPGGGDCGWPAGERVPSSGIVPPHEAPVRLYLR